MGVGKIIGGMWAILGGAGVLIAGVLLLYTPESTKKVPRSFVCAPESSAEKVKRATVIISGNVEAVLPGNPYADVWVKPTHFYKGQTTKFVRFAAWPKQNTSAKIGDLHFTTGTTEYLWYFRPLRDGTLTTSSCYGTHTLAASGLTDAEGALLTASN
jgi:hypothetical protein